MPQGHKPLVVIHFWAPAEVEVDVAKIGFGDCNCPQRHVSVEAFTPKFVIWDSLATKELMSFCIVASSAEAMLEATRNSGMNFPLSVVTPGGGKVAGGSLLHCSHEGSHRDLHGTIFGLSAPPCLNLDE